MPRPTRRHEESEASRRTGRAVGLWIGLALCSTVGFNVFAIAAAVRTDSGLVTDDYYQKSLVKDPEDTRRERFAALGWQARLDGPASDGSFAIELRDRQGRPVRGARLSAEFFRTTQAGLDRQAILVEREPGRYTGRVAWLVAGQYEARVRIRHGAEDLAWHRPVSAPGPSAGSASGNASRNVSGNAFRSAFGSASGNSRAAARLNSTSARRSALASGPEPSPESGPGHDPRSDSGRP